MPATPRSTAHVPASDALVLDAFAGLISDVLDEFWAWASGTGWKPYPVSPLETERRMLLRQYGPGGDWDGSDAALALALASGFQGLSAQYLEGLRELLLSRQVIVPLAPIVRSSFEASSRIVWILQPLLPSSSPRFARLPIRTRAARVQAVRLEDFTRAKTVALSLGHSDAPKWGGAVRTLRKKIIPEMFYQSEVELLKSGKLIICKQSIPGFRDGAGLYEEVFGGDWKARGAYDWLSNASHPTPSVIRELMVTREDGARQFQIEDATYPIRLARLALVAFVQCWDLIAQYLGHRDVDTGPLLDRAEAISPAT